MTYIVSSGTLNSTLPTYELSIGTIGNDLEWPWEVIPAQLQHTDRFSVAYLKLRLWIYGRLPWNFNAKTHMSYKKCQKGNKKVNINISLAAGKARNFNTLIELPYISLTMNDRRVPSIIRSDFAGWLRSSQLTF